MRSAGIAAVAVVSFGLGLGARECFQWLRSAPPEESTSIVEHENSPEPRRPVPAPQASSKVSAIPGPAQKQKSEVTPEAAALDLYTRLTKEGKPDKARKALEEAVKQNPNSAVLHNNLGNVYLTELQNPDMALAEFKSSLALEAGDMDSLGNLVDLSSAHNDSSVRQKAAAILKEHARANPNNPETQIALGDYEMSQNNYAEAERLYGVAGKANGAAGLVNRKLGEVSLREGQSEKAVEYMLAAKQEEENKLGLARQSGDADSIQAAQRRADDASGDYALALMKQGKIGEASEIVDSLREKYPDNQVWSRMGADLQARKNGLVPAAGLPRRIPPNTKAHHGSEPTPPDPGTFKPAE